MSRKSVNRRFFHQNFRPAGRSPRSLPARAVDVTRQPKAFAFRWQQASIKAALSSISASSAARLPTGFRAGGLHAWARLGTGEARHGRGSAPGEARHGRGSGRWRLRVVFGHGEAYGDDEAGHRTMANRAPPQNHDRDRDRDRRPAAGLHRLRGQPLRRALAHLACDRCRRHRHAARDDRLARRPAGPEGRHHRRHHRRAARDVGGKQQPAAVRRQLRQRHSRQCNRARRVAAVPGPGGPCAGPRRSLRPAGRPGQASSAPASPRCPPST